MSGLRLVVSPTPVPLPITKVSWQPPANIPDVFPFTTAATGVLTLPTRMYCTVVMSVLVSSVPVPSPHGHPPGKNLRANDWLTTNTGGAPESSRSLKSRPFRSGIPIAPK